MPRKRSASAAELPAPASLPPAPVGLPRDVMEIIFSLVIRDWHDYWWNQSWNRGADGRVISKCKMHAHHTLRLVCKEWSRVTGGLVRQLQAPSTYTAGSLALATAFPRVTHISTGVFEIETAAQLARFEGVLLDYASCGRRVCVEDDRCVPAQIRTVINVHCHLGKKFWKKRVCLFNNPELPVSAWPSERDPRTMVASFDHPDQDAYMGLVLGRADVVIVRSLTTPVRGHNFRASVLYLDHGFSHGYETLTLRYPPANVRALLDPERWADGRLPSVRALMSEVEVFPKIFKAVRGLVAAVAPLSVTVYAHSPHLFADVEFSVADIALVLDEIT